MRPFAVVPVDSHVDERAAALPAPQLTAGLCWGGPGRFEFELPAEEAASRRGGGMVIRWPAKTVHTIKISEFTPVWRRYDVMRVRSEEDPEAFIDGRVTREALVPVDEETQKYVGGGIGYVVDPGRYGYEERVIHTYVHLKIPAPQFEAEKVGEGEEGVWPAYQEDRQVALVTASPYPYGSSFGWTR